MINNGSYVSFEMMMERNKHRVKKEELIKFVKCNEDLRLMIVCKGKCKFILQTGNNLPVGSKYFGMVQDCVISSNTECKTGVFTDGSIINVRYGDKLESISFENIFLLPSTLDLIIRNRLSNSVDDKIKLMLLCIDIAYEKYSNTQPLICCTWLLLCARELGLRYEPLMTYSNEKFNLLLVENKAKEHINTIYELVTNNIHIACNMSKNIYGISKIDDNDDEECVIPSEILARIFYLSNKYAISKRYYWLMSQYREINKRRDISPWEIYLSLKENKPIFATFADGNHCIYSKDMTISESCHFYVNEGVIAVDHREKLIISTSIYNKMVFFTVVDYIFCVEMRDFLLDINSLINIINRRGSINLSYVVRVITRYITHMFTINKRHIALCIIWLTSCLYDLNIKASDIIGTKVGEINLRNEEARSYMTILYDSLLESVCNIKTIVRVYYPEHEGKLEMICLHDDEFYHKFDYDTECHILDGIHEQDGVDLSRLVLSSMVYNDGPYSDNDLVSLCSRLHISLSNTNLRTCENIVKYYESKENVEYGKYLNICHKKNKLSKHTMKHRRMRNMIH